MGYDFELEEDDGMVRTVNLPYFGDVKELSEPIPGKGGKIGLYVRKKGNRYKYKGLRFACVKVKK